MAQSGNWGPNFGQWFVGYLLMGLWTTVGYILSIFGMWQMGADWLTSTVTDWKPTELGDAYLGVMTLGGGSTHASGAAATPAASDADAGDDNTDGGDN